MWTLSTELQGKIFMHLVIFQVRNIRWHFYEKKLWFAVVKALWNPPATAAYLMTYLPSRADHLVGKDIKKKIVRRLV